MIFPAKSETTPPKESLTMIEHVLIRQEHRPSRPEGTLIQAVTAACGHTQNVRWDGRFRPDTRELDGAVEMWKHRDCNRCRRERTRGARQA